MSGEKIIATDRIVRKIRIPIEYAKVEVDTSRDKIPVEYAEVEVDTSRDEISNLITRLISDDEFRVQFNKNSGAIFRDVGIHLDEQMIKKIEDGSITALVRDLPPDACRGAGIVLLLAIAATLIFPEPLYTPAPDE